MRSSFSLRWVAVSVFIISSTLNYMDRQLLATLAPLLIVQLHFNQTGFGLLISAFSIAYAASTLFSGWFLDRVGVNRGISAAVGWWSMAAIATGLVNSLTGLTFCRAALGVGESAGVPAVGKLNGIYLKPEELALGAAVNQIGLSLGLAIAPLWIGVATSQNWRLPFVITGILGFIWIPGWWHTSRRIRPEYGLNEFPAPGGTHLSNFALLRDKPLILLVIINVLWMGSYSLWSNWTTLYLTRVHHLTLRQSASYVWIPPVVSNLGGFLGGWMSLAWMRRGVDTVIARRRAIWVSAIGSLATLLLPLATNASWATAIISISFFFALSGSVNIYALPIDIYGASRSGLAIAALTFSFGILQTLISPLIGYLADRQMYTQTIWIVTIPLLIGALVLLGLRPLTDTSVGAIDPS